MKKIFRITLLTLTVIFVCLSFTGCVDLDEMRACYATIDGDDIILNGETYILVPKEVISKRAEFTLDFVTGRNVYVCESDVPLLLAETRYTYLGYATKDEVILCITTEERGERSTYDYEYNHSGEYDYYCREDKYDELVEEFNKEFTPEKYAYVYTSYDYDTNESTGAVYTLNDEEITAVDKVISTVEPVIDTMYLENFAARTYVDVYACSDDLLFCEFSYTIAYSYGGDYAVIIEGKNGIMGFAVPSEYNLTFSKIMAEELISLGIYDEIDDAAI